MSSANNRLYDENSTSLREEKYHPCHHHSLCFLWVCMISLPTLLPGPVVLIILALSPFKRVVRWKCINLDSLLQYKALFEESPLVKAQRQLIQTRTFLTRPEHADDLQTHEFHETKLCISAELCLCLIRPSLRTLKRQRVLFDAHPKTEALKWIWIRFTSD